MQIVVLLEYLCYGKRWQSQMQCVQLVKLSTVVVKFKPWSPSSNDAKNLYSFQLESKCSAFHEKE